MQIYKKKFNSKKKFVSIRSASAVKPAKRGSAARSIAEATRQSRLPPATAPPPLMPGLSLSVKPPPLRLY